MRQIMCWPNVVGLYEDGNVV